MKKLFGALILVSASILACQQSNEESAPDADRPLDVFYVRTAPVEQSALDDAVHVTGVVLSDTEAKPAFKTGGVIARTFVKEGDAVSKGQLLAKLNLTEIEAQVNQARLGVEKAQRDLQRVKNLYADSIATLEQLQNATTGLELAEKSLQIAKFNLSYSEVRSPIQGKVISQLLNEGEIAAPGMPVYYIMGVQPSDWKIVAGLTDKNWGRIKKGDGAKITFDAYPGLIVEGKVIRLSDVANPQSGTFDVEISFPANDKRIAAGLLAHVDILPGTEKSYATIPVEAMVSSNGKSAVVYIPADGKASKRIIQIQQFQGERIAVQSGLEGVREVITAGSGFLEDGDKIMIEK